jgi:predicted nucleic acid-binding protein
VTASGLTSQRTLVWDTSPLLHAIKAGVIDRLGELATTWHGVAQRNVTTAAVLSEIAFHGLSTNQLAWLEVVHVDDLAELDALVRWMQLVSGQKSNHGEATVLAWAEIHSATAVIDDTDARRAAQKAGQPVQGSLRVLSDAVQDGEITEYAASALVDALLATGARYPFGQGGFIAWATAMKLL